MTDGPTNALERLVLRWLTYWHGRGAEHQRDYYRCGQCRRLVTWNRILIGGCVCGWYKVSPAVLTRAEKLALIATPWRFGPSSPERERRVAARKAATA